VSQEQNNSCLNRRSRSRSYYRGNSSCRKQKERSRSSERYRKRTMSPQRSNSFLSRSSRSRSYERNPHCDKDNGRSRSSSDLPSLKRPKCTAVKQSEGDVSKDKISNDWSEWVYIDIALTFKKLFHWRKFKISFYLKILF
jgi:hypothetical protein